MDELSTLILGLLFRLGIPIGLTTLAIWFLRRLDTRWQAEAEQPIPVAPQGIPCWQRKNCSKEKRANCPACQQSNIPCWQLFRSKDGLLREDCINCDVFREAPIPVAA